MLGTSLGMRMKNMKSKAFCTLKHCLCVRLGCMAILKKKFISEFIRFWSAEQAWFCFLRFSGGRRQARRGRAAAA